MEINQEDFNQVEMASIIKQEVGNLVKDCEIDLDVCVTRVFIFNYFWIL
jgi:hypothetical protein